MTAPDLETAGPPLARENTELLGHERAEHTLLQAYNSGRLPHAWLLSGPRGIGKATLAYRFARFVLAETAGAQSEGPGLFGDAPPRPESLAIAPSHDVFARVAAGGHADLRSLEIGADPKTGRTRREIAVEDVRQIGHFLRMTSAEGGWRVVVVDAIDSLNRNAANALLKVLEEPPARALLLLVSHAPGGLLATLRSRCCHLPMAPLPDETVLELMSRYAPGIAESDRTALARLAEGSIGRVLDLAQGGGLNLYRGLLGVLEGLPRIDVPKLHALGDRLAKSGDEAAFRTGMELLIWWLARLIRLGAGGAPPDAVVAEVIPGESALMARLLEPAGLARWLPLWDKIPRLFAQADAANLDRKQVVITAFLELEAAAAPRA